MQIKLIKLTTIMFIFFINIESYCAQDPKDLVNSGLSYIKQHGLVQACKEFNNPHGKFVKKNQYLFVIKYNGEVLAHGGNPKEYLGKNLFNAKDQFGTPYFQLFVEAARRGGGTVSYYFPTYKTSYIAPINNIDSNAFIGSGVVHSTIKFPATAAIKINKLKQFVDTAAQYVDQVGPQVAYKEFNDPKGKFIKNNWYIFVVGYNGLILAHGGDNKMIGTNISKLTDKFGTPLLTIFKDAANVGGGVVSYYWQDYTQDNQIKFKITYVEPLSGGQAMIMAGYYENY